MTKTQRTSMRRVFTGALLLAACTANAHVTLEQAQAPAGSYYKAVFAVPHGCKGSATLKIRVRIPDGVIAVKPQPKAGWQLEVVQGSYAKPYTLHGARLTSGVREVAWTGRLPDAYFDEFALHAYVAGDLAAGTVLHFPVVQECEEGVSRWIETTPGSVSPAPALTIVVKP